MKIKILILLQILFLNLKSYGMFVPLPNCEGRLTCSSPGLDRLGRNRPSMLSTIWYDDNNAYLDPNNRYPLMQLSNHQCNPPKDIYCLGNKIFLKQTYGNSFLWLGLENLIIPRNYAEFGTYV